ncbi:hypothetical protein AX15_006386 [Amanita polypyramis BW_CC]|nr:hypothetical protein AX15_006386 [Amanita polypyramis BW_CC]
MPSSKLLRLLALSTLVLLASALSIDSSHLHPRHATHNNIALSKRNNSIQRCKSRSGSSHNHQSSSKATHSSAQSHISNPSTGNHTTAVSTGSGIPKIGIAYPLSDYTLLQSFKTPKVGFFYNWSPYCPEQLKSLGYTCAPMLWGYKQIADFTRLVKANYATYVLGMNEPNEPTQSNMSPADGAKMWKEYIQPLGSQGYTLISPACTNGPSGKKWMQDFFTACSDCRVDAIAMHFYGTNATDMVNYMIDLHQTFQKPIWVTEFACTDFTGQKHCSSASDFLTQVKGFMDNTDWVHAYFAFGVMFDMYNVDPVNQLLGSNGKPTSLGELYIN